MPFHELVWIVQVHEIMVWLHEIMVWKLAPRNNGVDQILSRLPRITGVGTVAKHLGANKNASVGQPTVGKSYSGRAPSSQVSWQLTQHGQLRRSGHHRPKQLRLDNVDTSRQCHFLGYLNPPQPVRHHDLSRTSYWRKWCRFQARRSRQPFANVPGSWSIEDLRTLADRLQANPT
jgi:hypothetical protein